MKGALRQQRAFLMCSASQYNFVSIVSRRSVRIAANDCASRTASPVFLSSLDTYDAQSLAGRRDSFHSIVASGSSHVPRFAQIIRRSETAKDLPGRELVPVALTPCILTEGSAYDILRPQFSRLDWPSFYLRTLSLVR